MSRSTSSYRPAPPRHGSVHVHNHYGGGYYGRSYWMPAHLRISTLVCSFILIFMFVGIVMVAMAGNVAGGSTVGKSTVQRTALKPYESFQRGCWEDNADWLSDSSKLNWGMEQFYKATGVQPALVIAEDVNGDKDPSSSEVEAWATEKYDQLIGHERGVLLLFCEWYSSDYDVYYMAGEDAQTVMDSEACDILMDYVHAYYTSSMTEDEYFANVFAETGDRIMSVTPTLASRLPMILGVVVVAVIAIAAVKMLSMRYKREKERAEETERILNTPNERL